MHTNDLISLIEGCKANDRRSQEALYNTYYDYARNIVRRYCNNPEDMEEGINDAFLKVFKSVGQFNYQGPFEAWMVIVMRHAAINAFRPRKAKDEIRKSYQALAEIRSMYDKSSYNAALGADTAKQIEVALSMLSQSAQKVMRMVMMGFKYEEIADIVGTSTGTVKWHVHAARKKMSWLLG
jgi:RNA polymerase sigma-70 factor (ECF subfamily)